MLSLFPSVDVAPFRFSIVGSTVLTTDVDDTIAREAEHPQDEAKDSFERPVHQQLSHRQQILFLLRISAAGGTFFSN